MASFCVGAGTPNHCSPIGRKRTNSIIASWPIILWEPREDPFEHSVLGHGTMSCWLECTTQNVVLQLP